MKLLNYIAQLINTYLIFTVILSFILLYLFMKRSSVKDKIQSWLMDTKRWDNNFISLFDRIFGSKFFSKKFIISSFCIH